MIECEIVLWAQESVPLGYQGARTAAAAVARRSRTHLIVATSGMRSAPKLERTEPQVGTRWCKLYSNKCTSTTNHAYKFLNVMFR